MRCLSSRERGDDSKNQSLTSVPVDDVRPSRLGNVYPPAIDMSRDADDKVLGHFRAQSIHGPDLLHGIDVPPNAACRYHDGRAVQFERIDGIPRRLDAPLHRVVLQHPPTHPRRPPALVDEQLVHHMSKPELDKPLLLRLAHGLREHAHDLRASTPGDVEPRHRVPVAVGAAVAALGPADVEEEAGAAGLEVALHAVDREVDEGLGPAPRPVVLALAVEARGAEPVAQRQRAAVLDAHAPLLRRVDAEDAAERPERLPAEALLALLVDEHDGDAALRELEGGDETREARAYDHHRLRLRRLAWGLCCRRRGHFYLIPVQD